MHRLEHTTEHPPEFLLDLGEPQGIQVLLARVAQRVHNKTNLPVSSAWGFGAPDLADQAARNKQMDIAMIGRPHLENPTWTYQAAKELNKGNPAWVFPPPYAHWLARYHDPRQR